MRLANVIFALFVSLPLAAELPRDLVLVPLRSGTSPGAFGSLWEVEAKMWNAGPPALVHSGVCNLAECGAIFRSGEIDLFKGNPEKPWIAVTQAREQFTFSISLRNLTNPSTSEVRLPVVDLTEMSQGAIILLDIPVSPRSREHLRIYLVDDERDPSPEERTVVIAVFDATADHSTGPLLTSSVTVHLERSSLLQWGQLTLLGLDQQLDGLGAERVRIELSEDTDAYLWGFVTVTEDIENQPLVIAPE